MRREGNEREDTRVHAKEVRVILVWFCASLMKQIAISDCS